MNYRHAFHAGNFADVFKHAVLMRCLDYLKRKDSPFRVIDTHAGDGIYDLKSKSAITTGEGETGIGKIKTPFSPEVESLLAPYRAALAVLDHSGRYYPGSPALIREALRRGDRATFNELHPEAFRVLKKAVSEDRRVTLQNEDGYIVWNARVPPTERRGMVLVDPPFESREEFAMLAEGLERMARKWPTGMAMLWYPIKDRAAVRKFEVACCQNAFADLLVLELQVDEILSSGPLAATGLIIANPPWTLASEMKTLLPALKNRLGLSAWASWRIEWLKGPA